MSAVTKGSFRAYVLASRPQTLPAAFVPVAVGTAVAMRLGEVRWLSAIAALFGAIFIQIGTNLANDVFDYEKGADDEGRLGPARAAQSGWLTPSELKRAVAAAFGVAVLFGLYLIATSGPAILVIGVVSILAGIAYTGGPYPLAYNGLGDVFVIVFFGFVAVAGTTFVALGRFDPLALACGLPIGALANCILVVNNVRDREGDERVGKRTVIVRYGRRFGEIEYLVLLVVAFGTPIVLVALGKLGIAALLPLGTVLLARRLYASLRKDSGADLNRTLASTAKMLVLFGLSFAIGIAVNR